MSLSGVLRVARAENAKLRGQPKALALLGACVVLPCVFVVVLARQSDLPTDTLFGRGVKESGFAVPLFVLAFAAHWALPAVTSVIGGDIVSSEDRYGTWKTVLARARTRGEVFAGKALTAMAFSLAAITLLAVSSVLAGLVVIGRAPLLGLSGNEIAASRALALVALAWFSVLPPALGFTAVALFVSTATRSSAAGVGLPVLAGLVMELLSLVRSADALQRLFLTSAFGAWHGLFAEPAFHRPLVESSAVSAGYVLIFLAATWALLSRRDIGG